VEGRAGCFEARGAARKAQVRRGRNCSEGHARAKTAADVDAVQGGGAAMLGQHVHDVGKFHAGADFCVGNEIY
jgi:hypothetical protein